MLYTPKERQRIHLQAKRKIGMITKDAQDRFDFMQQCIDDLTGNSGADDDEAEQICQMLWEEQGGD